MLCDLQGQSYETAARQLGCPVGTVKSRLARVENVCELGSSAAALLSSGMLAVALSGDHPGQQYHRFWLN